VERIIHNRKGITLIEVLSAMIVLSVGILAMAPMMVLSISGNGFSEDVTTVAAAAQRSVENMISRGSFPSMPYVDTSSVRDGKYKVKAEVKDHSVDASVPDNVFEVNVTVLWSDDAGVDRNLSFITYSPKP